MDAGEGARERKAEVEEEKQLLMAAGLQDMKASELTDWLEKEFPSSAAEDWDNVGLLVGDDQKEISHIFLALDLTDRVLEEAVSCGAV